jgi:CHAT domain-containing protein
MGGSLTIAAARWLARAAGTLRRRLGGARLCGAILGAVAASVAASGVVLSATAEDRARVAEHLSRGADAYRMGDLAEATRRWTEAVRLCRIAGDPATEAEALARRGEALQSLGHLRAAAEDLEQALQRADSVGDPAQLASVAGALGNLYFQVRALDRARPLFERSLALARQANLPPIIATSQNNLGNLLAATGQTSAAIDAYDESAKSARLAGDDALFVTATTNRGRIHLREGNAREGIALLQTALSRAALLPTSRDKAYALIAIGRLAEREGKAPKQVDADATSLARAIAYEALSEASRVADVIKEDRAGSLAYGYLAEVYRAARRGDEAVQLAARAIFLAQKVDAPDLLYRWEWLQARLAKSAGDRDRAIAAYRRSVAALQAIRQDIPVEYTDGRSSFRETVGPLYFELADLLLQSSAELPVASDASSAILLEVRNTVETLKTAEIRDYFKDQCLVAIEAKQTTLDRATGPSSRTTVLYPVILPERIELLVSFADGQRQVVSRVDETTLTQTVRQLRLNLETLGTREFFEPAQRLYDWLIRPIEAELTAHQIDTLVIVPDGVLRTVPFGSLHDGAEFLVGKYALATAPSLTLIDPKPIARQGERALLSGLSKSVQGYAALPFVTDELRSLSRMGGATILEDAGFMLGEFENQLRDIPYSVVHIASHGEFDSDPAKTYILTYDGRLTLDRLEQAVKFSEFRDQPLELLTLSACRTAAGDDRAALGLAGIAIKAGARSAVASLWFINDEASSRLIKLFYERLGAGVSKAKALQQAQLELIKDRRFRHPGYWSPFLLIGNWL